LSAKPVAVCDACVFYPAMLRDLLIRLARAGLYQAHWTKEIQGEWTRALLANQPGIELDYLERKCTWMNDYIENCLISGYVNIVPYAELPNLGDRHVAAATICAGAEWIVTFNLKTSRLRTCCNGI